MGKRISVVINTYNEEHNIKKAIESIRGWVDEIIVCDMHSSDETVSIAKDQGAKVVLHKYTGFVEPARNFAISKADGEWILILDADEETPPSLANKIQEVIKRSTAPDFIEIPRKNIIFNKWMKASMWWPDYHIRLFRKGKVVWKNAIHSKPQTEGQGLTLPAQEALAIIHHNYQSVPQFIERMNRYSSIQAKELKDQKATFNWKDLIEKPLNEFLTRFFAKKGYLDGLHGLVLSLLQALSFVVVYSKLWELDNFKEDNINLSQLEEESKKSGTAVSYWINYLRPSNNLFKRFFQKIAK